ncbi:MAG: CDP-alcohol phosphatidyltransferase family protein [Deltaproteobacteria bacterium]|nr:CDP-alcohol phosphatidyltransferase family protein [Deltaproteobacteria bacterium]
MASIVEARKPFNFAHALTSVRLVLLPIFLCAIDDSAQQPNVWRVGFVILLFLIICASDYYDGALARALGLSSDCGKVFDNLADITFLLATLSYLVQGGIVPWWIPTAIALAFGQYTLDSWLLSGRGTAVTLVSNPIGHWAGILNYIFTGVCSLYTALQRQFPPALLYNAMLAFWLAYLLLAIGMRLRFFLSAYKTR